MSYLTKLNPDQLLVLQNQLAAKVASKSKEPARPAAGKESKMNKLAALREKYSKDEAALKTIDQYVTRFGKEGVLPDEHTTVLEGAVELQVLQFQQLQTTLKTELERSKAELEKAQKEKADLEAKKNEASAQFETLKGELDKTKTEFQKDREILQSMVKNSEQQRRELQVSTLVKGYKEAGHYPDVVEVFEFYARQEASSADGSVLGRKRDASGQIMLDKDQKPELEKHSTLLVMCELMAAVQKAGGTMKLEGELTSHGAPASDVDKAASLQQAGHRYALERRGLSGDELEKALKQSNAVTLQRTN